MQIFDDEDVILETCAHCEQPRVIYKWASCRECYEEGRGEYLYEQALERRLENE